MKATQLAALLKVAFTNRQKVLVVGEPGIGKSDIIDQVIAEIGAVGITRHPSIEDPTDAKGMPAITDGGKAAHFLPFGDLQKLIEADRLTVCHLEDFGQATPAVQAAYMQLLLRRSINGKRLSDHVVFVASTNDTKHLAGVAGFLEPIKSRFNTIVRLEVSCDDLCNWGLDHGISAPMVAWWRFKPGSISAFKPSKELTVSPSPRGWASVDNWYQLQVRDLEVYTGAVGEGCAVEYMAWLDLYGTLPNLDAIILNPDTADVPSKPGTLFAVASGLARKASASNLERVMRYLARMPKEFDVMSVRDAIRLNKSLTQTPAFVTWATKNSSIII